MTFGEIVCINLCSIGFEILFILGTVRILLGRIPRTDVRYRAVHMVQGLFWCLLLSVTGAVCYRIGFWELPLNAGQILWEYFVLVGWVLFVRLLYGVPYRTCWTTVFLGAILVSYGELLANALVQGRVFDLTVMKEQREYLFWLLVLVPSCRFLCLFFVRRAGRSYRQWVEREDQKKSVLLLIGLYPVLSRMLLRLVSLCEGKSGENPLISLSFLLVIHLILVHVGREEQQKERILQQQVGLQQQSAYIEKMEQIQAEVRRFRHDLNNMMAGVYLQAKEGDLTAVQAFIRDVTEDFDRQTGSQIRLLNQLANVHMTEVKGLLLEKLARMQREKISCELEVLRPLDCTRIRSVDLCRCLGILLDNAVEEVCGRKDGYIHVMISSQEYCTTFRVKNTLYGMVDLGRLGMEGYSTKGTGRGIGLSSYRHVLEKYDFVLSATAVEDGYFIQELKIQEM